MDDDKQRINDLDAQCEVHDLTLDNPDNDVVIINRTIPEVILSDNSGDFSSAFEDICDIEKDVDVKPIASFGQLDVIVRSDDETYCDFVVLDDDDSSELLSSKEIKLEQLEDHLGIEENSSTLKCAFSIKSETKVEATGNEEGNHNTKQENLKTKIETAASENIDSLKIENVKIKTQMTASENTYDAKLADVKTELNTVTTDIVDVCKSENLKTPSSSTIADVKLGVNSLNASPAVSLNYTLRPSLSSNETFVLQLDTTDALDSCLDKTASDRSYRKFDSKGSKGSLIDNMKESDSKEANIPVVTAKVPEADSLILTADEELETEMSLVGRDKNEKIQDSIEQEKPAETDLKTTKTVDEAPKQADKAISDTEPIPKNNSSKPNADTKKDDASSIDDKRNSSTETNKLPLVPSEKVGNKTEQKKVGIPAGNGKKSDTSRPILWVSNVTLSVKATDLKQYISRIGKVLTAKVVTDGKKCYGYVVMDNPHDANECVKTLNNAYFEGKKISLSFTRPPKSNIGKNKETPKLENDKPKLQKDEIVAGRNSSNEKDAVKISKSNKDSQPSKCSSEKRRRSPSRSRSGKVSKRRTSNDPLTTKFRTTKRRDHRDYRQKSRSPDRHDYKDDFRERMERDRLKRRLVEEQRRNREEMVRQMQREEKQREVEFRLEQERRKLQLERELFEKERRELTRLDAERRKIEKERLEVLQQRSKLEEEFQKSRMKRKADEFNLSSTIVKPQEIVKTYDKHQVAPKTVTHDCSYRKQYDKFSDSKNPFQKIGRDNHDERKTTNDAKNSVPPNHRHVIKTDRNDFKLGKENRGNSKMPKRGEEFKNYDRPAPPPPKLDNDFDLSIGRKAKHSDHKHEYADGKSHVDRKPERGGRKIEVIDRKYYTERPNETSDRKHDRIYRKPEFEDRKQHSFPERKYEYGREVKRYREESFPERDNAQRTQWPAPVNYNEPWKANLPNTVAASSPIRYQEGNFPAAPYGGPRIPPFYYHPPAPVQEYPRYDHCAQVAGRKY